MAKSAAFGVLHRGIAFGVSLAPNGSVAIAGARLKLRHSLA